MTLVQSFFLGVLQGIAEFLPISSSGHLIVLKHLFGLEAVPQMYDILLHLGTLFAVFVVFWKPIAAILGAIARFFTKKNTPQDREYLALVIPAIVATLVTAVIGLLVSKLDPVFGPKLVSVLWIVTGIMLIASSFAKGSKTYEGLRWYHGLFIGLAQGIGTLPGISRSGITIAGGLATGLERSRAGEFAFLLAIPAILGAFVLELKDVGEAVNAVGLPHLALGFLTSFIVGFFALKLLMPLVKKGKLYWFALYLIPVGIAGLFFF